MRFGIYAEMHRPEEIVDQEIAFIGTPDRIIRSTKNLQQVGGIGELAILSN